MSDRRSAVIKALQKIGIQTPTDDEIDTAANQLDFICPQGQADASDEEADLAVSRGEECKRKLTEKRALKAAEKLQKESGKKP